MVLLHTFIPPMTASLPNSQFQEYMPLGPSSQYFAANFPTLHIALMFSPPWLRFYHISLQSVACPFHRCVTVTWLNPVLVKPNSIYSLLASRKQKNLPLFSDHKPQGPFSTPQKHSAFLTLREGYFTFSSFSSNLNTPPLSVDDLSSFIEKMEAIRTQPAGTHTTWSTSLPACGQCPLLLLLPGQPLHVCSTVSHLAF